MVIRIFSYAFWLDKRVCYFPSYNIVETFSSKFVLVFFDDILIYSSSLSDHINHLFYVFSHLANDNYFLNISNYLFAQEHIEYLGHIISIQGVSPDLL